MGLCDIYATEQPPLFRLKAGALCRRDVNVTSGRNTSSRFQVNTKGFSNTGSADIHKRTEPVANLAVAVTRKHFTSHCSLSFCPFLSLCLFRFFCCCLRDQRLQRVYEAGTIRAPIQSDSRRPMRALVRRAAPDNYGFEHFWTDAAKTFEWLQTNETGPKSHTHWFGGKTTTKKSCEVKSSSDDEVCSWLKRIQLVAISALPYCFRFLACCLSSKPFSSQLSDKSFVCAEVDDKEQKRVKLPVTEKHRDYPLYLERMISFNGRRKRTFIVATRPIWGELIRDSNRKLMRKADLSGFLCSLIIFFGTWFSSLVSENAVSIDWV